MIQDGGNSAHVNVKAGVPRGFVSDPLLFLTYINDITDSVDSLARMFADDTSLMYSSQSNEILETVVNSDLHKIEAW